MLSHQNFQKKNVKITIFSGGKSLEISKNKKESPSFTKIRYFGWEKQKNVDILEEKNKRMSGRKTNDSR